ncbi:hypothetical protein CXG81DRAFT_25214 [Caulochytrium protostelioides]|uniref:Tetraspannin-domain-containing protein n=1 Tax=Caulochytrium protostelioides TaxID=1555241 RepID=A0A4P9WVQ4_9FUNG|nr:Tetraspannin-domain-containing protein [Caulochytrium protostelioides]RKP02128.1 hypothetical protein CXG81DRAFT_25214 [Caulochytrium protostelioides]|eukprot:RKP02128.1 hypothetical protein CXG81DRAFT_25214 [Caulochytrium protostelioides]
MPLLSQIRSFSLQRENFWATGGFMFVKNLLLLINFLSLLAGLILIGGGGYLNAHEMNSAFSGLVHSIAAAAICIGVIVALISFVGCFGAANEKGMLLRTYFALLCIVVILEIGVGAAAIARKDSINSLLVTYYDGQAARTDGGSLVEVGTALKCCWYGQGSAPGTCDAPALAEFASQNCFSYIEDSLTSSLATIGGAGVAIGVIEVVGLIFSAVLFVRIAKRDRSGDSLMNEAWRINRNKVSYGYSNYQYV